MYSTLHPLTQQSGRQALIATKLILKTMDAHLCSNSVTVMGNESPTVFLPGIVSVILRFYLSIPSLCS